MDINSDLSNICTPTHTSMGVPYMMAEQSSSKAVTGRHKQAFPPASPSRACSAANDGSSNCILDTCPPRPLARSACRHAAFPGMQPFLPIIGQGQGPRLPLPARGDCHSLLLMNGAAQHSAIGGRLRVPVRRLHGWYLDGLDVSGRMLIGRQRKQLGWSRAEAMQALTRV